jgi:hypothetical protein
MTLKDIANLIPTAQALTLAGENIRVAKKKKASTKDLVELGATNIVGTSLLRATAHSIEGL